MSPSPMNQDQWVIGPFLSLPQKTHQGFPSLTSRAEDALLSLGTALAGRKKEVFLRG